MTSVPATDERLHSAVILTVLDAALGPIPDSDPAASRVYQWDDVKGANRNDGDLPDIYAIVGIQRTFLPARRMAGLSFMGGWRVSIRYAGRTTKEAQWALNKITTALEENRLTVAGYVSTPLQHADTPGPQWDDGWMSGTRMYTYVIS